MTPAAPCPKTSEPYYTVAIRIDERYHHKLSREPTRPDICTVCPQDGKVPCPGCHLVQYCSEECLKKDLPIHRLFCQSFKLVSDDKRPHAGIRFMALCARFFRAIFIPENGKPRWTWVTTTPDRLFYYLDHLYHDLPTEGLTHESQSIQLGYHSTRVPKHGIISTTRSQLSRGENKSSINKFLQSLGPPGQLATHWGPVIVLAFKAGDPAKNTDPRCLLGLVEDVEMADVALIFHTLVHNLPENPCVVDIAQYHHKTIPAVKINCLGDRRRFHPGKDPSDEAAIYEAVTVPNVAFDPAIQWPSIFAFTLGLPWVCRVVYSSEDFWVKGGPEDEGGWAVDGDSLTNPELGCLHAAFIAPGRFEAWRPLGQQLIPARFDLDDNPGTVLIFHMYGERIPVEHFKMFRLFCEETDVMNLGRNPEQAMEVFHKAGFREFWDVKKKENILPGMDLARVPSPYSWEDKLPNEDNYMESRLHRANCEKLFKQAAEFVAFGHFHPEEPIFMSRMSWFLSKFERQSENKFWQR